MRAGVEFVVGHTLQVATGVKMSCLENILIDQMPSMLPLLKSFDVVASIWHSLRNSSTVPSVVTRMTGDLVGPDS